MVHTEQRIGLSNQNLTSVIEQLFNLRIFKIKIGIKIAFDIFFTVNLKYEYYEYDMNTNINTNIMKYGNINVVEYWLGWLQERFK